MEFMNLLTPKRRCEYLDSQMTLGEALAKMSQSKYTMLSVLECNSGRYLYSVSAYDILAKVLETGDLEKAKGLPLSSVSLERFVIPVTPEADFPHLVDLSAAQNYVPIVDEKGVFLGIVTRRAMINALFSKIGE